MKKTAILFPGQGSQFIGMGQQFIEQDPQAAALMDLAEKISGFPLRTLCFEGPMEDLTRVLYLQPALTVINLICWQQLLKLVPNLEPAFFAGHSLGEYSALYAAGVAEDIGDGIVRARKAIASGAARAKLDEFVAATQALAGA